jgi:tetratricopeptide (TPR) repeat protein
MALDHSRLLAASLTAAALLGTSCSTPSDSDQPKPGQPGAQGPGGTGQPAPGTTPQGQGGTLEAQRRAALAEKYYETAQALRLEGKLDAALSELLKAKEMQPENAQILNLLTAVRAELGHPAERADDWRNDQERWMRINHERARAAVQNNLQTARNAMAESNFVSAIDTLRIANLTIQTQDQVDWADLPDQVKTLLADAEQKRDEQVRAREAERNQELAARLRAERAEEEARRRDQVDTLLRQSQVAYRKGNFTFSQELATKALQIEPTNAIAADMAATATKAARDGATDDYLKAKAEAWRVMQEADEALKVPQNNVLEMDHATWDQAQRRALAMSATAVMDPQDLAVWDRVRAEQVGKLAYTEETGAYVEVVKQLQQITKVPIIITPEGRTVIDGENLKMVIELVTSISLENFLNHMVNRSPNLAWTVSDGVVIIGNKSQAAGTIVTEVHPVGDIVFKRTQFLPPRIRDIPGDSTTDDTPRTGGEGEEKVAFIELADLVEQLKNATDPKYWESSDVEIKPEDAGFLVIKASPDMQRQIKGVLSDMRRFATPVVTVDSRFLTVSRNFLQEVGVDFRGLGGSGNKGTAASLDDITNGLQSNASLGRDNGGTGDPAANPLAGAFFNDGGDGDVRARSENYFTTTLGRALSPNGGLTGSFTLIDDTEFNMILRAVEKQENAEIVNSQILSVLNRERGHVAIINQTAYVRDFDVEVAQASFIADPKVDLIQDGLVLDVQPVIQQDRKYITLNLTPTVAELTRPIPTFTTSLAGSTLPVTLQLPNLTVTSFSTTVIVPDGGSVLLGGLRQVFTKERRAEVPLLARLPLISFLFKQEGTADENRSLMVMVRAWITDLKEAEAGK